MDEPCADCTQSTLTAWHGFTADCKGCAARAVARGPNYFRCRTEGKQDRRYRAELDLVGVTHQQVQEAARADALHQRSIA